MKTEHKTIKKTLVARHVLRRGNELKCFEFEKVELQYDGDGSVQFERPYTQTLYLLVLGRKEVWFTEDQFDTLRFLVDMEREHPAPSLNESMVSQVVEAQVSMPGVTQLPKVKMNGKTYYRDEKLREYRAVDNPHDRIPLEEVEPDWMLVALRRTG